MADISSGIVVGFLWLVREVAGASIQHWLARSGRIGFVDETTELLEQVQDRAGNIARCTFVFSHPQGREELLVARWTGHLYNDSATPVVLAQPRITHWGLDGVIVTHRNPQLTVNGVQSVVATVPAHGTLSIELSTYQAKDQVDQQYYRTVPVLSFATVDDRAIEFPLHATIRTDDDRPQVAWDARNRRVVQAGTREWVRARTSRSLGFRIGRTRSSRP